MRHKGDIGGLECAFANFKQEESIQVWIVTNPLLCRSIVRLKEEDKEEQKEEIGERRVCRGIGICGQAKVWGLGQMGNENYKEERKGKD